MHHILKKTITAYLGILCVLGCFQSCKGERKDETTYIPYNTRYARGFTIEKKDSIFQLTVYNPWQKASDVRVQYKLHYTEKNIPGTIRCPVKRVICLSTTHLPYLLKLEETASITGITNTSLVHSEIINQLVNEGNIADVGNDMALNYEKIIALQPDVVFCYGIDSETLRVKKNLERMGIQTVIIAEYLENSPLGKAEWIKFFSVFYNKTSKADAVFDTIAFRYEQLQKTINKVSTRPMVITGMPWKGSWWVPGGKSYVAAFINDAGGHYLWEENSSNSSFTVPYEEILIRGSQASVWLNLGDVDSKEAIIKSDKRLKHLRPLAIDSIYNNNKRVNARGGNDFWETGIMEPEVILADLIQIFHPGTMPERELVYYVKLE